MFVPLFYLALFMVITVGLFFELYHILILQLLFLFFIFHLNSQKTLLILSKIKLFSGKAILLFSFWGCIFFILKRSLEGFPCENCFRSYLNRIPTPMFDIGLTINNFQSIYQMYPRLIVLFGLFSLYVCIFVFSSKKARKC